MNTQDILDKIDKIGKGTIVSAEINNNILSVDMPVNITNIAFLLKIKATAILVKFPEWETTNWVELTI